MDPRTIETVHSMEVNKRQTKSVTTKAHIKRRQKFYETK